MKCCDTIWLGKGVILSNELDCEPDVLRAHEENYFFSFTGGGSNLIFIIYWEQNLWNPRTGMLARSTTIYVSPYGRAVSKGVVINGKKFDSALCLHQVKPNFRLLHKTLQVKMKLENGGLQRRAKAKPFLQAAKLAKIVGNRYNAHFPYWHLMILDSVTSPSLFNSETNSLV